MTDGPEDREASTAWRTMKISDVAGMKASHSGRHGYTDSQAHLDTE